MKFQRLIMREFVEVLVDFRINLEEINVIAEIGAQDGLDSIELLKCFPHAYSYSIDGLKENYDRYLKNLENIHCFHAVISDFDGDIDFFENHTQGLHSIYPSNWSPVKKNIHLIVIGLILS